MIALKEPILRRGFTSVAHGAWGALFTHPRSERLKVLVGEECVEIMAGRRDEGPAWYVRIAHDVPIAIVLAAVDAALTLETTR